MSCHKDGWEYVMTEDGRQVRWRVDPAFDRVTIEERGTRTQWATVLSDARKIAVHEALLRYYQHVVAISHDEASAYIGPQKYAERSPDLKTWNEVEASPCVRYRWRAAGHLMEDVEIRICERRTPSDPWPETWVPIRRSDERRTNILETILLRTTSGRAQ